MADDIPYLKNIAKAIGDVAKIKIETDKPTATLKSIDPFENGFSGPQYVDSCRRALFGTFNERFRKSVSLTAGESSDDLVRRLKDVSPVSPHSLYHKLDTARQTFEGVTSQLNAYLQHALSETKVYGRFAAFLSRLGFVKPDRGRQRVLSQFRSAEKELEQLTDAVHKKLYGADHHQIGGIVGECYAARRSLISLAESYHALQRYAGARESERERYKAELASIGDDGKSITGRTYAEVSLDYHKSLRDTAELPHKLSSQGAAFERAEQHIQQLNLQIAELKAAHSWTSVMLEDVRRYEHFLGIQPTTISTN